MYYDKPLEEAAQDASPLGSWWGLPVYVHYADGRVERVDHVKTKREAA